jgi:Cu+-exporting ATPase
MSEQEKMEVASLLRNSSHPLSRHILKALNTASFYTVQDYTEALGKGLSGLINGKIIYAGSKNVLPNGIEVSEANGVHIVVNMQYKGSFIIKQQWRNGLSGLISQLANFFELQVLSGDTAKDEAYLKTFFPLNAILKFEQTPIKKLNTVSRLQEQGKKVMMLGDGLNDAGSLKQSNFGIALTDNINNFTPGCDAILKGSSLNDLPKFFQLSKDGLKIIKISFAIAILYNCIGLYYAVQGTLYPLVAAVLMPVSTITIISFTSVATRYFARKNKLL